MSLLTLRLRRAHTETRQKCLKFWLSLGFIAEDQLAFPVGDKRPSTTRADKSTSAIQLAPTASLQELRASIFAITSITPERQQSMAFHFFLPLWRR